MVQRGVEILWDTSSEHARKLQRLPKNLGWLQCALVLVPRFWERPKEPWRHCNVSFCKCRGFAAYAEVLRGIGAMVSLHHGVPMKIRYNGAMQCGWHWFVWGLCRYKCDKCLEEGAARLKRRKWGGNEVPAWRKAWRALGVMKWSCWMMGVNLGVPIEAGRDHSIWKCWHYKCQSHRD